MNDSNPHDVTQDLQGNPPTQEHAAPAEHPQRIGRYRIEKVLGKGGFGLVYLAHDEQLNRPVAVKVPHAKLISKPEDAEAYLAEARTVANLDHHGIVPVHDVGSMEDCPCYVVSKYIAGTDLATKLKQRRLEYREAAELVAIVADALHYAHKQGLVHRDVKPGNILIGNDGKPYVVDFGLALREENIGKGPNYAGTPAYMSPEQARGEGHRVDGRSDIFSLGVVFYELLAGRRPFRGDSQAELLEHVTSYEPRPLRQYDEKMPKELERICHKAMAKRASERYSSAHDLAEDLRLFLQEQSVIQSGTSPPGVASVASETHATKPVSTSVDSAAATSASMNLGSPGSQPIKIVPKGLRSFDAHDADFFLELLPGPRDRGGLPDSLRFWKTRIEETDPDNTFSLGLIYGPSGCGKSSLVKAGLLPRLSEDLIPVYIEATPEETEIRLLHGVRKRCPALEDNLSLKDTLAGLRRGQGIPVGKKVLIVLDQFEQWLHAKKDEENSALVQALRQCDGGRVQCIVMVRDDFWMAATRFMRELEVRLVEAQNLAAVDLFPIRHAEKVLAAFGRAFGTLPDNLSEVNKEQKSFLTQSVAGLAEEGKVICVRLALFAEMMKGKTWTPATLKQVGGTKGVGVTFLEETFSAATASPEHRYHQKAARAILKSLLPDSGTDLKGTMRSRAELLEASGYGNRPKDFDDLIRILDHEIRLITPTDPEGKDADDNSVTQTDSGQKYFQLTHDYLVHSLRDWLTRKQKETRKGRAELKLSETSATWNAKPDNRRLPSWSENLNIRLFTDRKRWTEPQRKMMVKAGRVHGIRTSLVALLLVGVTFAGVSVRSAFQKKEYVTRAEGLIASLVKAEITQVPAVISDLTNYREWADPLLHARIEEASDDSPEKLHLALALLPVDEGQIRYLGGQLPHCTLSEFPVVRAALRPHSDKLLETLWQVAQNEQRDTPQRFQAAAALAEYAPDDQRWQESAPLVAQHLTFAVPSLYVAQWQALFQPAKKQLTDSLMAIHADRNRSEKEREAAAFVLAGYLQDQPEKLVDVILAAEERAEFSPLISSLRPHSKAVRQRLLEKMLTAMPAELEKTNDELSTIQQQLRDAQWQRQSLAAVALVQLGFGDDVWPLLEFSPNPSLRSFVIHHLGKLGIDHNTLAARLQNESDISIRRALIQSLGGLQVILIPPADRSRISKQLRELYVNDPDVGIHSSAFWALRKWGETLPELPVGEPMLTQEQQQRLAGPTADIEKILQQILAHEREVPVRQAAWERQLQAQPAAPPAALTKGLVVHYPLDETAGPKTANAIAGGTTGVYAGPGAPEWVPAVVGNGVRLSGDGGHFNCGNDFDPERTDAFSFGCWFAVDLDQALGALIAKMGDGPRYQGVDLWIQQGRVGAHLIHEYPNNFCKVLSTDAVQTGLWHHLMMTYDGSSTATGVLLYLDGYTIGTVDEGRGLSETIQANVSWHIGMRNGDLAFRGRIDDVRIYDRRLSADDVLQLYKSGLRSLAGVSAEARDPQQQAVLAAAFRLEDEPPRSLKDQLAEARIAWLDARWNRHWYLNGQGQTMAIFPNPRELGVSHIGHGFAISSQEVTVAQFRRFRENFPIDVNLAPTADCPVHLVNWFLAAEYCNWLSQQEGIPEDQWVYQPNKDGQYADGMKIKEDHVKLSGYRLPTHTEWEFACRAGTSGTYGFGEPVRLLAQYSWYGQSSLGRSHAVAGLKPNEQGLFDMHGNVWESVDVPASPVATDPSPGFCGGSYFFRALMVRSITFTGTYVTRQTDDEGFRVARTLPQIRSERRAGDRLKTPTEARGKNTHPDSDQPTCRNGKQAVESASASSTDAGSTRPG